MVKKINNGLDENKYNLNIDMVYNLKDTLNSQRIAILKAYKPLFDLIKERESNKISSRDYSKFFNDFSDIFYAVFTRLNDERKVIKHEDLNPEFIENLKQHSLEDGKDINDYVFYSGRNFSYKTNSYYSNGLKFEGLALFMFLHFNDISKFIDGKNLRVINEKKEQLNKFTEIIRKYKLDELFSSSLDLTEIYKHYKSDYLEINDGIAVNFPVPIKVNMPISLMERWGNNDKIFRYRNKDLDFTDAEIYRVVFNLEDLELQVYFNTEYSKNDKLYHTIGIREYLNPENLKENLISYVFDFAVLDLIKPHLLNDLKSTTQKSQKIRDNMKDIINNLNNEYGGHLVLKNIKNGGTI